MQKKIVFPIFLSIVLVSLSGIPTYAATLLQVTNTGDGPGIGNTNGGQAGSQSFVAGDWEIDTVILPMKADSQGVDNITLRIETDNGGGSGGCPSGTLVTNGSTSIAPFGNGTYSDKTFTFSPAFTLASGTKYWLKEYSPSGVYRVQGRDSNSYSNGQWGYFNGGLPPPTCQTPNDGTDTAFLLSGTDLASSTATSTESTACTSAICQNNLQLIYLLVVSGVFAFGIYGAFKLLKV